MSNNLCEIEDHLMGWMEVKVFPKMRDRIAISFIRMFRAGPEVSFRGSPTVSPTTAAL